MRFPYLSCVLAVSALSSPAVIAQRSIHCTPTKSQVVLRQRIAEMDAAAGRLDRNAYQEEIEALRRENKINDEQLANLRKALEVPGPDQGPSTSPTQAKASTVLQEKLTELNAADSQLAAPSNSEAQTKAEQALAAKLAELNRPQPAAAPPANPAQSDLARQALDRKLAELKTAAPAPAAPASNRDQAALARQALDRKMAELNSAAPTLTAPPTATQAKASDAPDRRVVTLAQVEQPKPANTSDRRSIAERALAEKMAELNRSVAAPAPAVAATPAAPATPAAAAPTASAPTAPAAPAQPAPPLQLNQPAVATAAAPEAQVRAQRALNEKLNELSGTVPAPRPVAEQLTKQGWERLDELTELYRSGKITPQEYHAERAKIVATLLKR